MSNLKGYAIHGRDGDIGTLEDILIDDVPWTARYLVADTGGWLPGRQVLLSPYSVSSVDEAGKRVLVELTKQQIEESPPLSSDQPISRQFETSHSGYYGWPISWDSQVNIGSSPIFGVPPVNPGTRMQGAPFAVAKVPDQVAASTQVSHEDHSHTKAGNPHLRSVAEINGYTLIADDGEVGRVTDFLVDEKEWAVRYLVISTGSWWSGKKILISPQWVADIQWSSAKALVHMPRSVVKLAPPYMDQEPVTRAYEEEIHRHYQRHGYWMDAPIHARFA